MLFIFSVCGCLPIGKSVYWQLILVLFCVSLYSVYKSLLAFTFYVVYIVGFADMQRSDPTVCSRILISPSVI
jgi:hypothetical protein